MKFATGMEGFVMLLRWFREDVKMGYYLTKLRWFQWGYMDRGDYAGPYAWYILVRLPSYLVRLSLHNDVPAWHQRCLLFKEPIPAGKGGWEMIEMPL